jgi:hypothetical protein
MNYTITIINTTTRSTTRAKACKSQYDLRATLGTWVDYHKEDLEAGTVAIHCAISAKEKS